MCKKGWEEVGKKQFASRKVLFPCLLISYPLDHNLLRSCIVFIVLRVGTFT